MAPVASYTSNYWGESPTRWREYAASGQSRSNPINSLSHRNFSYKGHALYSKELECYVVSSERLCGGVNSPSPDSVYIEYEGKAYIHYATDQYLIKREDYDKYSCGAFYTAYSQQASPLSLEDIAKAEEELLGVTKQKVVTKKASSLHKVFWSTRSRKNDS